MTEPPLVDALTGISTLRYVLFALAVLWAFVTARAGLRAGLVLGVLFVETAMAFWMLGLARPYGLFVDAEITRWMADLMVGAASPALREGALAGEPPSSTGVAFWLRLALSPETLRWLPQRLPLLTAIAPGLLVAFLWRDAAAPLAGALCLALFTGELDTLAGVGFVPGLWARPGASLLLVALLTLLLLADRLFSGPRIRLATMAALSFAWVLVPASTGSRGVLPTLLLLTFDQGLLLWPAAWGLARRGRALPRALCAAGAGLSLLAGAGAPVDPWGAHALYRLGLLLAAAVALDELASRAGPSLAAWWVSVLPRSWRAARESDPGSLAASLLLLALVPTSFLVQWNAKRQDATYVASMSPVSPSIVAAMTWIRDHTDKDATFVAGRAYAVAIPALGERRVLRAPDFPTPRGERARTRIEGGILHGREVLEWAAQYRVRYVFVAPSDFSDRGLERPEEVAGRGGLRLLYENEEGMRVYSLPSAP